MRTVATAPLVVTLDRPDLVRLGELSARLGADSARDWSGRLGRSGTVALGAESDGRLVAYAAAEVRRSFGRATPAAWIDAFGVDLAYRGHGIGRTLLAELLSRLRSEGADHVFTLVPLHDRTMAPFFRELGFRDEPITPLGREL
ncbi:MAG TPA: GNAT family N-acetyltransferase [Candidatus Limnocylindria bacterium]